MKHDTAREKVKSYETLEVNWDSFGSTAPPEENITKALQLIDWLEECNVPLDFVAPGGNSISFEFWDSKEENDHASITVYREADLVEEDKGCYIYLIDKQDEITCDYLTPENKQEILQWIRDLMND